MVAPPARIYPMPSRSDEEISRAILASMKIGDKFICPKCKAELQLAEVKDHIAAHLEEFKKLGAKTWHQ